MQIHEGTYLTDFQHILHTAGECGRFDAYYILDKPELDFGF